MSKEFDPRSVEGLRDAIPVDVAVFAHDEADRIAHLITDLSAQDIFLAPVDLRILILANGCSDDTVARAQDALAGLPGEVAARFKILDLPQGGKSRTGHRFIHEFSRPAARILGFMDADIRLPQGDTLRRMVEALVSRSELHVFTSRPVKDIQHGNLPGGPVARLVAAGGGGLTDWRKSICGQLFLMRAGAARRISLPCGLPVEDGFFRAMVLTDLLSKPEDLSRIDGEEGIFHVYESIRGFRELISHQTRIVIGSAVNAALYRKIRRDAPDADQAHALLMQAAGDEDWLPRTLAEELPRHGYVPREFLTKRWRRWQASPKPGMKPLAVTLAGLGLDAVVWLNALQKMRRGIGAGHW